MPAGKAEQAMSAAEEYQHIGAYLRDTREHFKLRIEDVAKQLHIRPKYIVALEEGRLDELPGKVYTRGYINNYADFLGLDPEEILARYTDLQGLDKSQNLYIPEPTLLDNRPGGKVIAMAGVLLVVVYIVYSALTAEKEVISIQPVEPVPPRLAELPESHMQVGVIDSPCFDRQGQRLYPPCYRAEEEGYRIGMPEEPVRSLLEVPAAMQGEGKM